MGDGLAGFWRHFADPHGMQKRLAIVDALVGVERHQQVLIDVDGIGARRFDLAVAGDDRPRPRAEKGFARDRGEHVFETRIGRTCIGSHQSRVEFSGFGNPRHGLAR
jgi:hypothetical protein